MEANCLGPELDGQQNQEGEAAVLPEEPVELLESEANSAAIQLVENEVLQTAAADLLQLQGVERDTVVVRRQARIFHHQVTAC